MAVLTAAQIEFFRTRGYLVVEDAVEAQLLSELQVAFAARVEESRGERSGRIRSKACFDKLGVRRSFCDCSPSPTRSAGLRPLSKGGGGRSHVVGDLSGPPIALRKISGSS